MLSGSLGLKRIHSTVLQNLNHLFAKMFPIMMLPLEIIFCIFQHIKIEERIRLRVVCRSWYAFLLDPGLLRHLNFYRPHRFDNWAFCTAGRCLDLALSNATKVFSLNLKQCLHMEAYFSGRLSLIHAASQGKFSKLTHLVLQRTSIGDDTARKILDGTKCLEHLDLLDSGLTDNIAPSIIQSADLSLRYLRFPSQKWREDQVESILHRCRNLKCVTITHLTYYERQIKSLLQRKWTNIQEIRLYFEDDGRGYSDDRYMRSLIKTMGPLQVTSPYLCLCVTVLVKKETKTLLKTLNVAICESSCTWDKD